MCWNRRYHLSTIDAAVKDILHAQGLETHSFAAHCLVEPHAVKPFKVYSAFAHAARAVLQDTMQPASSIPTEPTCATGHRRLVRRPSWTSRSRGRPPWTPTKKSARQDYRPGPVSIPSQRRTRAPLPAKLSHSAQCLSPIRRESGAASTKSCPWVSTSTRAAT